MPPPGSCPLCHWTCRSCARSYRRPWPCVRCPTVPSPSSPARRRLRLGCALSRPLRRLRPRLRPLAGPRSHLRSHLPPAAAPPRSRSARSARQHGLSALVRSRPCAQPPSLTARRSSRGPTPCSELCPLGPRGERPRCSAAEDRLALWCRLVPWPLSPPSRCPPQVTGVVKPVDQGTVVPGPHAPNPLPFGQIGEPPIAGEAQPLASHARRRAAPAGGGAAQARALQAALRGIGGGGRGEGRPGRGAARE